VIPLPGCIDRLRFWFLARVEGLGRDTVIEVRRLPPVRTARRVVIVARISVSSLH
jgi:hypothetical protein